MQVWELILMCNVGCTSYNTMTLQYFFKKSTDLELGEKYLPASTPISSVGQHVSLQTSNLGASLWLPSFQGLVILNFSVDSYSQYTEARFCWKWKGDLVLCCCPRTMYKYCMNIWKTNSLPCIKLEIWTLKKKNRTSKTFALCSTEFIFVLPSVSRCNIYWFLCLSTCQKGMYPHQASFVEKQRVGIFSKSFENVQ